MALKKICIYFPATNITVAISVAESHNLIKREKNRWLSYKQHLRKSKHDFRKMQRAAFYAKKYHLAPWRVLGIGKCGALTRAAAKHTPRKGRHRKPNRKRGGAEPSPLNRLGNGCRFFRRAWLSFIGFYRSLHLLNLRFFGRLW